MFISRPPPEVPALMVAKRLPFEARGQLLQRCFELDILATVENAARHGLGQGKPVGDNAVPGGIAARGDRRLIDPGFGREGRPAVGEPNAAMREVVQVRHQFGGDELGPKGIENDDQDPLVRFIIHCGLPSR
jgi:hypothetical protein